MGESPIKDVRTISAHVPVTAVCFVDENILLSGSGGYVSVYDLTRTDFKLRSTLNVLGSRNIHGFAVDESGKICAYGERFLVVFHLKESQNSLKTPPKTFHDRILDSKWLIDDADCLAVLLAHNEFILFDPSTGSIVKNVRCEQNSVLFSGRIIANSSSDLFILAGACLGYLYIWNPLKNAQVDVELNLSSTGGIFDIAVRNDCSALALACEDRAIYVKRLNAEANEIGDGKAMYGHAARIWKIKWIGEHLVSAGEDSQVLIWNVDQVAVIHSFKSSNNSDFVSLAIENSSLQRIAAGLIDGAIRIFSTKQILEGRNAKDGDRPGDDTAVMLGDPTRHVICLKFIDAQTILSITQSGEMVLINLSNNEIETIDSNSRYGTAAVLAINRLHSKGQTSIALAHGYPSKITVFNFNGKTIDKLSHFNCPSSLNRAYFLTWLDCSTECSKNPLLVASNFEVAVNCVFDANGSKILEFNLAKCVMPPSTSKALKHFDKVAITSGAHIESAELFVFGNNCGSVLSVKQATGTCNAIVLQIFPHVHGRDGCYSVKLADSEKTVITCGGASAICFFSVDVNDSSNPLNLLNTIVQSSSIDFVVSHSEISHGRKFVCGFGQKTFILASAQPAQLILAKHFCSGRRREWDLFETEKDGDYIVKFAYIRASQAFLVESKISPDEVSKEMGLRTPLHSLRIHQCKFICHLPQANCLIFALVSEDSTVSIIAIGCQESNSSEIIVLHRLTGHISGVRSVEILKISSEDKAAFLLVTGGSRGIAIAWHLTLKDVEFEAMAKSTFCIKIAQIALTNDSIGKVDLPSSGPGANPLPKGTWRQRQILGPPLSPDMRFMDLAILTFDMNKVFIAAACSDAAVRVLKLSYGNPDEVSNLVSEFCLSKSLNFCQLQVKSFKADGSALFVTGDTGGFINLWNLKYILEDGNEVVPNSVRIHQSGINALQVDFDKRDRKATIFTGGDDTAIMVSYLRPVDNTLKNWDYQQVFKIESAHSSQISGISYIDSLSLISTVSIDQRIRFWKFGSSDAFEKTKPLVIGFVTCVADCSSLAIAYTCDKTCLFALIVGEGCQLVKLST